MFSDNYDSSIAPFEYALQLYWNAAKYAKKIKCSLANPRNVPTTGVCYDMFYSDPLEWKYFLLKASYVHSFSLKKITFGMNVPVIVKMYFINDIVNFPQLVSIILIVHIYFYWAVGLLTCFQTESTTPFPDWSYHRYWYHGHENGFIYSNPDKFTKK